VAKDKQNKETIIEKAVEVFGNINQKIKSLIDCSSKDFDTLNQSFKEYHTTIKDLSDKATLLFNKASQASEDKINKQLDIAEMISGNFKSAYTDLLDIERYMINLMNDTAYSNLYFNNLKQNISTLKLLSTNLQLEPYYRKLYINLITTVKSLSECCQKFGLEFQLSETQIKIGFEIIDQIKNLHFSGILQHIERLQKNLTELIAKKAVSSGYNEILEEIVSKKSKSSSEIITNLQFQDIVRQKIEHVQLAQAELLRQLNDYSHNKVASQKTKPEINLAIVLQIRNIGSLQAAQLIHANIEYQKAVKKITEKFGEMDFILEETLRLLNLFNSLGESIEEYFYKPFEKELHAYNQATNLFRISHIELHKVFNELNAKAENFYSAENNFNKSLASINSIFDELKKLKEIHEPEGHSIGTISQIIVNFDEFKNNSINLCKIQDRDKSEVLSKMIPAFKQYLSNIDGVLKESDTFINNIKGIVPDELYSLMNERNYFTDKDYYITKFNINQVEYYSIFEKEVDAIITNLNHLISQIDFTDIESKIDTKSLEELEKLYTMKSERDVHLKFMGQKVERKETENEIELF
jgi:hypothetical protein